MMILVIAKIIHDLQTIYSAGFGHTAQEDLQPSCELFENAGN